MLRLRLFVVTDTDLYLQQPQLKTQQIAFLCFQNAFLCVAPHPGDSCQVVSGAHFILDTVDTQDAGVHRHRMDDRNTE